MKFNQNTKYDIVGIGATPLDTLMIIENFPNGREVHPTLDFICSSGGRSEEHTSELQSQR